MELFCAIMALYYSLIILQGTKARFSTSCCADNVIIESLM